MASAEIEIAVAIWDTARVRYGVESWVRAPWKSGGPCFVLKWMSLNL